LQSAAKLPLRNITDEAQGEFMKMVFSLILLLAGFNSAASTLPCDNCDEIEREATALMAGVGTNYVFDLADGAVVKYSVARYCEGKGNCERVATRLLVETEVSEYVSFVQANRERQVDLDSRNDWPENVYELVEFPQMSAAVSAHLKNGGLGLVNDFLIFLGAINPISGFNPSAVSITIRVHLWNGGTALYLYNHTTQTWERVRGQARDSENNIVPEVAIDASGGVATSIRYNFSPNSENLINFLIRLGQLGVPIRGPRTGRGITCVTDSTGTHCVSQ